MESERPVRALATRNPSAPAVVSPYDNIAANPAHFRVPSLRDYLRIFLRHKWTVISATIVALALGAVISFATIPVYEAVGRIVINRESEDTAGLKSTEATGEETDYDYMVTMDTQMRILESDAVAKLVIRKLSLDSNPAFAGKQAALSAATPDVSAPELRYIDPHREAALVSKFRGALEISSIPRTRLMEISFASQNPDLAQKVVNTLIDTYIEQNYKTRLDATTRTSVWLSQQLSELELKVEEAQEKLVRYQKDHGIVGLDEKQNIITSKLDDLNKNLTAAQADRMEKEALNKIASSGNPELLADLDSSSSLAKLRSQEADLHRQLAQASVMFDARYPAVKELQNQLNSVQTDIKAEIERLALKYKQEYVASVEHEKLLQAALEKQKNEENNLSESAIEYDSLKRDVESGRQLYENLLAKSKEVGILTGLHSSNIRIVDPASVPTVPVKPNFPHNLVISLLVGLAAGMSIAFVMESLDDGVRSVEQLQTATELPLLAVIPLDSAKASPTLTIFGNDAARAQRPGVVASVLRPRSDISEAYRALRTTVLLSRDAKYVKVLMVTSALPQEGKTTTSINLSVVLAQQSGKVLLIEGDMRRASICRTLGMKADVGLNDVLVGNANFESAVQSVPGIQNLWVLPAGSNALYPSEVLGSPQMKELLASLREQYDHIIIDTPPALAVTDAVMLSAVADATIVVTRSGTTNKAALRRVYEVLNQVDARLIGVVLNAMDLTQFGQEYYGRRYYRGYYSE